MTALTSSSSNRNSTPKSSALDLLNAAITELEVRLGVATTTTTTTTTTPPPSTTIGNSNDNNDVEKTPKGEAKKTKKEVTPTTTTVVVVDDLPDICKLEFKVGVITKVWIHESADKLYCEEIDIGDEDGPRQIASGLRYHFTLEQMLGQRVLVISNLKPKNLVGFKSHGMVLCAAKIINDETKEEIVEFVEPPIDAIVGEIITFDGLPLPIPATPNVVEKKKIFITAAAGMMANNDGIAQWNGHTFMTTAGPCYTKTITNCPLR